MVANSPSLYPTWSNQLIPIRRKAQKLSFVRSFGTAMVPFQECLSHLCICSFHLLYQSKDSWSDVSICYCNKGLFCRLEFQLSKEVWQCWNAMISTLYHLLQPRLVVSSKWVNSICLASLWAPAISVSFKVMTPTCCCFYIFARWVWRTTCSKRCLTARVLNQIFFFNSF